MVLQFFTGMTFASAADSATNWAVARIAGSGQAPAWGGSDTTIKKEGAASNSAKIAVASTDAVVILDWYANAEGGKSANTTVDLTTAGNEVVCGWVQITTVAAMLSWASGGLYLLLQSSSETGTVAPTVYSKWYVGGSDMYPGGWVFYMVDTRKTPSATAGGGCVLSAIRRVGVGMFLSAAPGTIKADNIFVDAIWYGRPIYTVWTDDGTPSPIKWSDLYGNSNGAANGLIEQIGSIYFLSCGLQIGSASQSYTTVFADATGQKLEFKRYRYNSGGILDSLNYSDYYFLRGDGAQAGARSSITIGTVVGLGDSRQGVLGGGISSPDTVNLTWKMDFQTNKANLSAVKLYGMDTHGAKGGVLLNNDAGGTETVQVSGVYINCGEVDPGTTGGGAELLNIAVINPLGGTAANRGLRLATGHKAKKISFITSGTPATQHMLHMPSSGGGSIAQPDLNMFGNYVSGTLWHGEKSDAGNLVMDQSGGTNITVAEVEVTGSGTITIQNVKTLEVNGVKTGSEPTNYVRCRIEKASDGSEIMNQEAQTSYGSEGFYKTVKSDYNYLGDVAVKIKARYKGYLPFEANGTITSSGLTVTAVWLPDPNFV